MKHIRIFHIISLYICFFFAAPFSFANNGAASDILKFEKKVQDAPDNPILNSELGLAYLKSGNYAKAVEPFKQAIEINPDEAWYHYFLSLAYGGLGKHSEKFKALDI